MLWSDHGSIVIVVKIYEGAVWILFMRLSYFRGKQEKSMEVSDKNAVEWKYKCHTVILEYFDIKE